MPLVVNAESDTSLRNHVESILGHENNLNKWLTVSEIRDFPGESEINFTVNTEPTYDNINYVFQRLLSQETGNQYESEKQSRRLRVRGGGHATKQLACIRLIINGEDQDIDEEGAPEEEEQQPIVSEKDMHEVFQHYAYTVLGIKAMTLIHTEGRRRPRGFNEWIYPDMVGLHDQRPNFRTRIAQDNAPMSVSTYSFELKLLIEESDYRKKFFQAVSNSKWANHAYLVVCRIVGDDQFRRRIFGLCELHGIGIIELLNDDGSINSLNGHHVIARHDDVDWLQVDYLSEQLEKFKNFIEEYIRGDSGDRIEYALFDDPVDEQTASEIANLLRELISDGG